MPTLFAVWVVCARRAMRFAAAVILVGCGGGGTGPAQPPDASLTIDANGVSSIWHADVGFYTYAIGPEPDKRAMYLTFGRGARRDSAGGMEFFRMLSPNQNLPEPGTRAVLSYNVGISLGLDVRYRATVNMPFTPRLNSVETAAGDTANFVRIDSVRDNTAYGRLHLLIPQWSAGATAVRISGPFTASRRLIWEQMPRWRESASLP